MKISNKMQSKNGLNIIIVGCGKVGMTLIEQLSKEGHDITIIDKNAAKVQEMSNLYDIMGLVGNGASYSVQMEAGIENADLIIAVTASDELNLLCCTVAKQVGDCAAIARVRTPDYSKEAGYLREKLGLTMIINPELEASLETARILYLPTALEVNSFAHGQAEIVKFKIPDGNLLDGMTIATLGKSITNDILICAIEREGEVYIPGGNFQMAKDDIVSFVAPRRHIRSFLKKIGFKTKQVKDAMIVGGGKVSNAKLITKINRSTFKNVISKLDLGSVIYPRYITSEAIIAYVRAKKNSTNSNIETLYHMFDNRAEAIEFCVDEPSSVTGIPLKDLMLKNDLLVSFIYRNGKVQIPSGLDTIEVGDTVMIVTTHTGLDNIQDIIRS